MQVKKLIVICGQTATGKSALAVRIAKKFGVEIISADSRQVYRGLNIGSGKITKKEMAGIPHHLLDIANPKKQFTAEEFQRMGREKIAAIFSRGKIPIVCGGTGFYIDSLLNGTGFPEAPPNPALRKHLEKKSAAELFTLLKKLNPRRARIIDSRNPRRLIRAIEIAKALGKVSFTRKAKHCGTGQPYEILWIGLRLPADELKKRIAIRLFSRISRGMVAEVRKLRARGLSWKRMDELGLEYRYVSRYLRGLATKQEMTDKIKTEIYRYAKRQMTWFKRNKAIKWFSTKETPEIEKEVKNFLQR